MLDWFKALRRMRNQQTLSKHQLERVNALLGREADAFLPPLQGIRSRDGYQREASARQLGLQPVPGGVEALLERAGDWVPQVRLAAEQSLAAYMHERWLADWVRAAPALAAAHRIQRADISHVLERVNAFIQPHASALRPLDAATNHFAQRWLLGLQLAATTAASERLALILRELASKDIGLAQLALRHIDKLDLPAQHGAYAAAANSPFASVRLAALRWLFANGGDGAGLVSHAMDASPAVRHLVRLALPDHQPDMATMAAAVLHAADAPVGHKAAALALLGELGDARASDFAGGLLNTASAVLRRVAYGVRIKHATSEEKDRLAWAALNDGSSKVAKLAMVAFHDGAALPEREQLLKLAQERPARAPLAQSLAEMKSPWVLMWFLLKTQVKDKAHNEAWWRDWMHRARQFYALPDAALAADLRDVLQEKSPMLDAWLKSQIEAYLRIAKVFNPK